MSQPADDGPGAANCLRHALAWRATVLDTLDRPDRYEQPDLFPAHPRYLDGQVA